MKATRDILTKSLVLVALTLGALFITSRRASESSRSSRTQAPNATGKAGSNKRIEAPPQNDGHVLGVSRKDSGTSSASSNACVQALKAWQTETAPGQRKPFLAQLMDMLQRLPKAEALTAMREFLRSGQDAGTGQPFKVGNSGALDSAPTLRTAVMDLLARTDPAAAAAEAELILARPTTADEWAVSLRNYARHRDGNDISLFLKRKTLELVRNPAWQQAPTVGYFEAFDLLVHTNATDATPLLGNFTLMKDRPDLGHAAFLTLDRLAMRSPGALLREVSNLPQLAEGRPEMVAGIFARADVRDAGQRQVVESYLLAPSRTGKELAAFASQFPNANAFISNNLVTQNDRVPTVSAAGDAEALRWVEATMADGRFAWMKPLLEQTHMRLVRYVRGSK